MGNETADDKTDIRSLTVAVLKEKHNCSIACPPKPWRRWGQNRDRQGADILFGTIPWTRVGWLLMQHLIESRINW